MDQSLRTSLDSSGGGIAADASGNVFVAVVAATDINYANLGARTGADGRA